MIRTLLAATAGLGLLVATPLASDNAAAVRGTTDSFQPIATFNVPESTAAEIVAATPDGRRLVYSDAIGQRFGLVDISNPARPAQLATVDAGGDPTSVAVLPGGEYAIGAVQPGTLVLIDLATFQITARLAIGEGPDAVAVTTIAGQTVAVIAIENEGAAKGEVNVVQVDLADFAASPVATVRFDDPTALSAAGLLAVDDPQPEYVAIHGILAAVTLQENNGIAIIDISNPAAPVLRRLFSAGVVADRPADLLDDETIAFTGIYPSDVAASVPTAGSRIPDAIAWSRDGNVLFTADEGEEAYEGGRGWSARDPFGVFLRDDGGELEATAVRYGHYPDGRSDAKGIEVEGVATAVYGTTEFMFATSERGSFVGIYALDHANRPRFVQLLPTGLAPEGILPIPGRNLLAIAGEGDDGDGTITIYRRVRGLHEPSDREPTIVSRSVREPWGALSGMAASPSNDTTIYAVPDNALPSSIFRLRVGGPYADIREHVPVTIGGVQARYDLEGITVDTSIAKPRRAGFWLASEGNGTTTRNMLVQVDRSGAVVREIVLPADVDAPGGLITSNGFEGVAVSSDRRYLVVAIQRPFRGDETVGGLAHTRIARYDLRNERWETFFYPLTVSPGTIGLSEITVVGQTRQGSDIYAVIERDNRIADAANLKQVLTFTLEGLSPVDIATLANEGSIAGATVTKRLLRDVLPVFTPYEKVEGLALTPSGDLWVGLDNDGGEVESRLVRLLRLRR